MSAHQFNYTYMCKCLLHLLAQTDLEAPPVYSTVCKKTKVPHHSSPERDPTKKKMVAVYDLATVVNEDFPVP